ncbi:CAP domain-containing protein [Limobrevibacterium gyesilva]|nr:CAP domain-containing protein [Limobrevibacterium gyesilva]
MLPREIQARLLAAHNVARTEVGVPAMHWDDRLATDAEQWARHLARINALVHWGAQGEPDNQEGENLWMGSRGYFPVEQMVGTWAAEKAAFRRARSWEDNFQSVGHYTQMVWRSSTRVGCAIASNAQNDFLVCRYSPQGNFFGQKPY